jgi:hypothetical protein
MSERIQVLAQQILGKSSIDECGLQEVKDLAERFPYFAPAQFLLLEKLKRENAPDYPAQLRKAVLYYHNPLEFEYFISSNRFEAGSGLEEIEQPYVRQEHKEEKTFEPAVLPEKEISNEIPVETEPVKEFMDEPVVPETDVEDPISEESQAMDEKMAESIERVLQHEEEQMKAPVADTNNELVFEPYHTVDYFASQGIKLSQEEAVPKDRFSKQLKSFTEWLKTMKRLPESEISKNTDASSESKIQHLAEDSVHDANVVTEAMAEVWIKQGNKEKAIETYNKLGLLNPSKKAYFAGLIENLKHS